MNSGLFSLFSKCHSVTHGAGGPFGSGVDRVWTGGGPSLPHLSAGCQEAGPHTHRVSRESPAYNAGQQGGRGPERPEYLCPKGRLVTHENWETFRIRKTHKGCCFALLIQRKGTGVFISGDGASCSPHRHAASPAASPSLAPRDEHNNDRVKTEYYKG